MSVDVPDFDMTPVARGVPADGLTRTSCQVSEFLTPLLVALVTVNVICVVEIEVIATFVPLATPFIFLESAPLPDVRVTMTVGAVPVVSNINPLGTFKIIDPAPISPCDPSERTGPVRDVYDAPTVSADIADPPVAGVTVTPDAAKADVENAMTTPTIASEYTNRV